VKASADDQAFVILVTAPVVIVFCVCFLTFWL
jgi:hypothetical protein